MTYKALDGLSVVDCNFSVSSVYCIWNCQDVEGRNGRDLAGVALAVYGTRATVCLYNCLSGKVEELMLKNGKWVVTEPDLTISNKAKLFSMPTKAMYENEALSEIYEDYICEGHSLRYSGCFSLDLHQILIKRQGVYAMVNSVAYPSDLSLVFDMIPLAFLIEKAGGQASNGVTNILDVTINGSVDQRGTFVAGSSEDVQSIISKI